MRAPVEVEKATWEFEWGPERRFKEYCKLADEHNRLLKQHSELEVRYDEMKQLMLELRERVGAMETEQRKLFDRLEAIKTLASPKE